MTETFRDSPFIDFNEGVVRATPDMLFTTMPEPLSLDDKIKLFQCRVDVWQLGTAVAILKQIEASNHPSIWSHSAYGLVWVLTSYFEMIGKSLNLNSRKSGTAGDDFAAGFRDVYPSYTVTTADGRTLPDARLQHAWTVLRNGIYHLGYTKRGVVLHNSAEVKDDFDGLLIPRGGKNYTIAFGVNPHGLTRTIVKHFPTFIARLKDPTQTGLRTKFEEFVDDFHEAPPTKPIT
jgi:hypothetical protein